MQPIIRRTLIALSAALAIGVVASASASAATCTTKAGSKNYQLCIAGHPVEETGTIEASTKATSNFVLELPKSWETSIVCTAITNTPRFWAHGLNESVGFVDGELKLSGCALQGNISKKCGLSTTETGREMDGRFGSVEALFMAPSEGSVFLYFAFSNKGSEKCPEFFEGTREVAGEYECKLTEAKVEAIEHALNCATSSTRKLRTEGEEDVLSYTQTIALGGTRKGDKFSVYEGT